LRGFSTSSCGSQEQLVHGDFWDDNVLFAGDEVVLVTDFDFLGLRPPVGDLPSRSISSASTSPT
jgi:Ser/Thr protein kinase RdoA (MazF antagonist)